MNKLRDKIEKIRKNLPENFSLELDNNPGLYYNDRKNGLQRICNPIAVTAIKRKADGTAYGKEITFWSVDKKEYTCYILQKTLLDANATLNELVDIGLKIPKTTLRSTLLYYLSEMYPAERVLEVDKIGWTNSDFNTYIYPVIASNEIESETNEKLVLSTDLKKCVFGIKGSLKQWQDNICRYCENNENLTTGLCIGLSSPILRPLDLNGAIYNFVGRSSTGKTTAGYVAASLCGNHEFVKTWRLTSNGLEGIAEQHNDSLLVLDELSQVSGKDSGNNAYMIVNGSGKGRSDKNGNPKNIKTWRLNVISTGEICMAEKINEGGERVKGGQTVRAIDIYAEIENGYGIFNDLHSFSGGSELSNWFKQQTNLYYGVPMYEFTKEIAKSDNIEKLKEIYRIQREKLYSDFSLRSADGQVQRVADLFAGHITAGIFASSDYLGILTHNTVGIEENVTKVFTKWLANRGTVKSQEEEQIISHVRGFLDMHQNRFKTIIPGIQGIGEARSYNNLLGLLISEKNGETYYIFPKAFEEEICCGFDKKLTKQILKRKGILEIDQDGSNRKCPFDGFKGKRMVKLVFRDS